MDNQATNMLRGLWSRVSLRGVHYSDRHGKLDSLYRIHDPWGMETEREGFRFNEMNRLIKTNIGHVGTLLEIGSGEGHQSEHLLENCDRLYGVDVSARAVRRARKRCPEGTFYTGDIFGCGPIAEAGPFDLVTACEVIYYMKDIPAAIERISQLGRWCLITYYEGQAEKLDAFFSSLEGVKSARIRHGDTEWTVLWWRSSYSHEPSHTGFF